MRPVLIALIAALASCIAGLPLDAARAAGSGDAAAANALLLASAEPFEDLTESAFSASRARLDGMIRKTGMAAAKVRDLLPQDAAGELDGRLGELAAARKAMNRPGLARAAVEVYRLLVSAVTPPLKVPVEVSLLDYAGFRYSADLKARPADWNDMAAALAVANNNWAKIAAQITRPVLKAEVDKALSDMGGAQRAKSARLAGIAVDEELELVDRLEEFFAAQ
jgi:hypothetical protein